MNRGADHRRLFFTRAGGEYFEQLLGEGVAHTDVSVHAYCLMPNHFHLLVQAPNELSKFMQRITTLYARRLNKRHDADGPVFRARFRSVPIGSDGHLACVERYIHRNALDLAAIAIDSYRWSSYRCYAGPAEAPRWLSTATVASIPPGAPSGAPDVVDWAIRTAIEERDDRSLVAARRAQRVVACLMLDIADPQQSISLTALLAFPSIGSRDLARQHARSEATRDPSLLAIAERALSMLS